MLTGLNSANLFITGSGGWLGLNLLQKISELPHGSLPRKVSALVISGQDVQPLLKTLPSINLVEGDIRNAADCDRFCDGGVNGILIHAAGIIHPRKVSDFYDVNFSGCVNMLRSATRNQFERAVVVSSNSPCGCNPHPDHLFDENSPYNPYMHYGRSKMQMEQEVIRVFEQGKLKTTLIRAPWFYGAHQPSRQILFFKMIRDGKAPVVGSGENLRSMANAENLATALLLAATSPKSPGQIYWIADSRPYSMLEIISTIESLIREFGIPCSGKRMHLPNMASDVAFIIDKVLQAGGIYHQKIHVLSEMNKTIACSVKKAVHELNYLPAQNLEIGMRRSIQSCLTELHER